jgi:hypothetical protein
MIGSQLLLSTALLGLMYHHLRCEQDRAGAHGGPRWTGVWKDPQTNKEYDVDIVREKAGGDHFDIQVKPRGEGTSAACKPK